MAIRNRRGNYTDFEPSKLVSGEFAYVETGDPNSTEGVGVYAHFTGNKTKRLCTYDEVSGLVQQAKDYKEWIENDFDVNIYKKSTSGLVDTYEIAYNNDKKFDFTVTNGDECNVYIRYSEYADGRNFVENPTLQTRYIGFYVGFSDTVPTDKTAYKWSRYVGLSGDGTGDMVKAEYDTNGNGWVDRAEQVPSIENSEIDSIVNEVWV